MTGFSDQAELIRLRQIASFAKKEASIIVTLQNALMFLLAEIDNQIADGNMPDVLTKTDAFKAAKDAMAFEIHVASPKAWKED